ncbi:MAG: PadR family transcriptional regulator [Candidatus Thorarchaeota archaeon]|jgi:DNA-binding PadR family transcriptional regulator
MGPPRKSISRVELLILAQLRQGPAHGYAILSGLKEQLGMMLKSGTLYPALRRLSRRGLIKGKRVRQEVRPDAIEYALTQRGEKVLTRVLQHMGGEMHMQDKFWGFLGEAARGETATILIDHAKRHKSPIAFAALKRAGWAPGRFAMREDFLREYREYLKNELTWVSQRLGELESEEEEWEVNNE